MELISLSYIVWDVNPDAFVIPVLNHPVRWYGLSWAFGFLFSQQLMYYMYKKYGRPTDEVDTLTVYMVLAAVLGARLGHVLFYDPLEYIHEPWRILAVWEGGLASHGGAIGILVAMYFFSKKTKVKYLWILDRVVVVAALSGFLIRLGNLMNSEMVGIPTTVPWAFIFTLVDKVPRHPAQLYEAIYCFFLFVFLFSLWYKKRVTLPDGILSGWFLIILFSLRFIDEFFKVNQSSFEDGLALNMGQILSIPFVIAGVIILLHARNKRIKHEQGSRPDQSASQLS